MPVSVSADTRFRSPSFRREAVSNALRKELVRDERAAASLHRLEMEGSFSNDDEGLEDQALLGVSLDEERIGTLLVSERWKAREGCRCLRSGTDIARLVGCCCCCSTVQRWRKREAGSVRNW